MESLKRSFKIMTKTKITSLLLLALSLCLTAIIIVGLTVTASATDSEPSVVTSESELKTALGAADTVYIRLGENITATEEYTVAKGKTVTLDLNGFTLDMADFTFTNSGSFELCDSTGGGSVIGSARRVIYNRGAVTITDGTLNSTNTSSDASTLHNTGGTAVVNGGTVSGSKKAIENVSRGTVTVNGGSVRGTEGGSYAIYNDNATLIIKGGELYSESNGICNMSGAVDMTGGTVIGYYAFTNQSGTANISGGTVSSEILGANGRGVGINNLGNGTVNISGSAEIKASGNYGDAVYNVRGTVNVSGSAQIKAIGEFGAAISNDTGMVKVSGGTLIALGASTCAIYNYDGFALSGGIIEGGISTHGTVSDCLAPGYLYYDESGEVIAIENGQSELTVKITVGECKGHTYQDGFCSVCRYACPHTDIDEATGNCADCDTPPILNVISGDDTFCFHSFTDALAKAQELYTQSNAESTVKLLYDLAVNEPVSLSCGVTTLDLNGRMLEFTHTSGTCFTLDGAALTVTDTSTEKTGKIQFSMPLDPENFYGMTLKNGAALTWESGEVDCEGGFPLILLGGSRVVQNGGRINNGVWVDNGKYTLNDGYLVIPFYSHADWSSSQYSAEITVNGGDVKLSNRVFMISNQNPGYYAYTVTGGTFTNRQLSFELCFDPELVNISGGTFELGIETWENSLSDLLAVGYIFYDADGNILTLEDGQTVINEKVTVAECEHLGAKISENDGTHHWQRCERCNEQLDKTAHVYEHYRSEDAYLCSAATCISNAVYYKSCSCGRGSDSSEHVFEVSGRNRENHAGTNDYLSSNADGTHDILWSCCYAQVQCDIICTAANADADCTTDEICACGYVIKYGRYSHYTAFKSLKDSSHHIDGCTSEGCAYEIDVEHKINEIDDLCTTDDFCICGFKMTEALAEHSFVDGYCTNDGCYAYLGYEGIIFSKRITLDDGVIYVNGREATITTGLMFLKGNYYLESDIDKGDLMITLSDNAMLSLNGHSMNISEIFIYSEMAAIINCEQTGGISFASDDTDGIALDATDGIKLVGRALNGKITLGTDGENYGRICFVGFNGNAKIITSEIYRDMPVAICDEATDISGISTSDANWGVKRAPDGVTLLLLHLAHEGGAANCTHKAVCDICGGEYGDYYHSGEASKLSPNGNGTHNTLYTCCDTPTVINTECAPIIVDESCLTAEICACGHVITAARDAHDFGEFESDELEHRRDCNVCGTVMEGTKGEHDFSITELDENGHWKKCSICGAVSETQAHTVESGSCTECEYQPPRDGLSGGAIVGIVTGSAVVVGVGVFSLIWFVIKKKSPADLIKVFKK